MNYSSSFDDSLLYLSNNTDSNYRDHQQNNNISLFDQNYRSSPSKISFTQLSKISPLKKKLMMCRICEQYIDPHYAHDHSHYCLKKIQQEQALLNLNQTIKQILEKAQAQESILSGQLSTKKRKPTSYNRSRFYYHSQTIFQPAPFLSQEISRDQTPEKFETTHEEIVQFSSQINFENSRIKQFERKDRKSRNDRNSPDLNTQSLSPDLIRPMKVQLTSIRNVISYCESILKQDCISDFDQDLKYQQSLKLLREQTTIVKDALEIIDKRIEIISIIKKISHKIQQIFEKSGQDTFKQKKIRVFSTSFREKASNRSSGSKMPIIEPQKYSFKHFPIVEHSQDTNESLLNRNESINFQLITSVQSFDNFSNKFNSLKILKDLDQFSSSSDNSLNNEKGYHSDGKILMNSKKDIKKKAIEISLNDFEFISLLGVGAYGSVWKVKKKRTDDIYALKLIDIEKKNDKKFLDSLLIEKNIFEMLEGDFVVKAYYSFSYKNCLCFVQEYMKGGDFGQILKQFGALEQDIAQFYLAELVLAIENLHSKHIIHRDLKPENLLIDTEGHLKLADFGLSETGLVRQLNTEDQSKNNTNQLTSPLKRIIGTPDYIAPEVITGNSINNQSMDWWSFGIIVYEFLIGIPPFNDHTPEKIFSNIMKLDITWPDIGYEENCITPEAQDLIIKLLEPNPEYRYNCKDVKEHPFFKNIDWKRIRNMSAPLKNLDLELEEDNPKKIMAKTKLELLLKDDIAQKNNQKMSQLGVDDLLRLDLLAEVNNIKAKELLKDEQQ